MPTLRLLIVVQQQGSQATANALGTVGRSATGASKGVNLMRTALLGLGAGAAIRGLISAADSFTKVENRVRLTTSGTQEFSKSMKDVFNIAQETRQPLEATAILYSRLAVNTRDLGFSQQRLVGLVTDINKAVAVSGSTAQEARNGLIQLSQGFASGQLRGEEFRAVAEQLPFLLITIADGLGKPIGELRKLAFTGQLTPEIVAKAIESQTKRIAAAFATMTPTIEQAGTIIRNSFEKFVGSLNNAVGGSTVFGSITRVIADNMATIASVALGAATGLLAYAAALRVVAIAQALVAATDPLKLALLAIAAIIAALTALFIRFGVTTKEVGGEALSGFQRMGVVLNALLGTAQRVFAPIGKFVSDIASGVATLVLNLTAGLLPGFKSVLSAGAHAFLSLLDIAKKAVNAIIGVFVGGVAAIGVAFAQIPALLSGLPLGDALKKIGTTFIETAKRDFLGEFFSAAGGAVDFLGEELKKLASVYDSEYKTAQDAAIERTKLERLENEKKAKQLRELEESLKGAGANAGLDVNAGKAGKKDPAVTAAEQLERLTDRLTIARTKQIEPLQAQVDKLLLQIALAKELEKKAKGKASADEAVAAANAQIAGIEEEKKRLQVDQENSFARISVALETIRQVSPQYAADLERAAIAAAATPGGLAESGRALRGVADDAAQLAKQIRDEQLQASEAFASQLSSSLVGGLRSAAQGEGFDVLKLLADQFAGALEESIAGVLTTLTEQAKEIFKGLTAPNGPLAGMGESLGKGLQAAVGVAGLAIDLFSRGNDKSVQNNLVKSSVESAQATRGVVAGPTNIPIFQLGEELESANLGVIAAVDRVAAILLGQTAAASSPQSLEAQAGSVLGRTTPALF